MKMYGVFIGIDNYRDPAIGGLNYAKADAVSFYELLEKKVSPQDRSLWIITDETATKTRVMMTIGEDVAKSAKEEDIVIIHFSGHGSPEVSVGVNSISKYLIAHDTEYDSVFATGIDMERDVTAMFHRIRSKLVIFFLDSCFSGRAGGRTFEGPFMRRVHGYRGMISLKEMFLGEGRLIMAACDDDQVAGEDPDLGHGIFTHYLLDVITTTKFSGDTLTIGNVYDLVYEKVFTHTRGEQTPILNGRQKLVRIPRFF